MMAAKISIGRARKTVTMAMGGAHSRNDALDTPSTCVSAMVVRAPCTVDCGRAIAQGKNAVVCWPGTGHCVAIEPGESRAERPQHSIAIARFVSNGRDRL